VKIEYQIVDWVEQNWAVFQKLLKKEDLNLTLFQVFLNYLLTSFFRERQREKAKKILVLICGRKKSC